MLNEDNCVLRTIVFYIFSSYTKTYEVAIAISILCIVKGNRQCSSDLPQRRWASIFSVRRIYYLCSNPTNRTQYFHFSASFRAHYCTCTKMKIGEKKLANCCDSPNSPKFFPLQSFLLYGTHSSNYNLTILASQVYLRL